VGSDHRRRHGRALKINSDARYRFERGVDPAFTLPGLELATQMILDLCGGEARCWCRTARPSTRAAAYRLNPARVISLVGMDIPEAEQRRTLTALGFTMTGDGDPAQLAPRCAGRGRPGRGSRPHRQPDPAEGRRDAAQQPGVPRPILTPLQVREKARPRTIAALGLQRMRHLQLHRRQAAMLFGGGSEAVRVENPISSEMTHLRPDLLPGLLAAAARNQARGFMDLALFEVGPPSTAASRATSTCRPPACWSAPAARDPMAAAARSTSSTPRPMPRRAGRPGRPRKVPDHPQGGRAGGIPAGRA
jgi:phenylalanyl-tRNA synthetase beta chain